jgi:hypothetical protein
VSDDLKFASPDERSFAWPATENRRQPKPRPRVERPRKQPIGSRELADLKAFRQARRLARRWEAGDEDVTMQDIIAALVDDS